MTKTMNSCPLYYNYKKDKFISVWKLFTTSSLKKNNFKKMKKTYLLTLLKKTNRT